MRSPLSTVLLATLFLGAPATDCAAQRGAGADPVHGYQLQPPKGWVWLPPQDDRGQLVAQWCAERPLSPKASRGAPHTPTLRVYRLGADAPADDEVDGFRRTTPFRDLDDYIERQFEGRASFTSREAVEIDGVEGRQFVVEVKGDGGDFRLFGLAMSREDHTLLVEFEVLADHADKYTKDALRALASLKWIEPTAEPLPPAPWADAAAWMPMDPAARRKALQPWAEAVVAAAAAHPGAGWKSHRSKHWTVFSNAGAGDVKKALAAADKIREWAEEHFAGLGAGDALPAVLRIYETPAQLAAAQARCVDPRDFEPHQRTLHFAIDANAGTGAGYGALFRAVVWHWIDDHVPGAMRATPRWLDLGLWEYLRSSRVKGRSIEFFASEVETGRLDYQKRNDSMPAIWNLIQESQQPEPEDGAGEDPWGYTPECAKLLRWLLEDDGGKLLGKPDLLNEYFLAIGASLQKVGANPTANVAWNLLEDRDAKAAREKFYEWRKFIRDNANFIVVPLEGDAWQKVNERWLQYALESR